MDGANRWQRLWNVTLPGIVAVTILLLILRLGNILSVGFEQILLQRRSSGRAGGAGHLRLLQRDHRRAVGMTAAAGLVKGIVGLVLVLTANKVAHRLGQDGVYR